MEMMLWNCSETITSMDQDQGICVESTRELLHLKSGVKFFFLHQRTKSGAKPYDRWSKWCDEIAIWKRFLRITFHFNRTQPYHTSQFWVDTSF